MIVPSLIGSPRNHRMYILYTLLSHLFQGIAAASSAAVNPAQMVMMPPRNHTNKAIPAVPVTSVTFDILKNTPEPITVPITIANAEKKPIFFVILYHLT